MKIVRLDDAVLRSLISDKALWTLFPSFESLWKRYQNLPKASGCRCRQKTNPSAPIFAETRIFIQNMSAAQKTQLKQHLHADYLKMLVTDSTGRHKDFTW